ncbi:MAG: Mur ligase family protein [Planctomycetota bacterium]
MTSNPYPAPKDLDDLVQVLSSFTNDEKNRDFHKGRIRFDLKNMLQLCRAAGNPHLATPCIHITGSKGKGSTAWMLTRILQSLGLKTGTYTSPHLESLTERIAVQEESLSESHFVECSNKALDLLRNDVQLRPTFFEFMTLTAMMAFRSFGVDVAIYEVGLGGRLDATNVVQPDVAIITMIEREHCAILGATEEEIAQEKAGIIKRNTPVLSAMPKDQPARAVVEARAKSLEAPFWAPGHGLELLTSETSNVSIEFQGLKLGPFKVPKPRSIQGPNLACAAGAAFLFTQQRGMAWDHAAVQEGLDGFSLPGRFETVASAPTMILDGAHTPTSINAALREAGSLGNGLPVVILGLAEDKEADTILEMTRCLSRVTIFTSYNSGRSIDPAILQHKSGHKGVVSTSIEHALNEARSLAGSSGVVLVLGSFYLVGEARKVILS